MGDEEEQRVAPGTYTLTVDGNPQKTSTGFTGNGKAEYPGGDIYEGPFVDGIRQGKGTYEYLNGDKFVGTFENNVKVGLGRVTYKKGGFYHGHFVDGKREGEGTFKYANGDIYSGMWKGGKRHGKGTYVFITTKYAYEGEWMDGQIVKGSWTLSDGTKYIGGFAGQKPDGDGIWSTAAGTIVEGKYVQQVVPVDSAPPAKEGEAPITTTRTFWSTLTMVAAES